MTVVRGKQLTTFEVAPDGESFAPTVFADVKDDMKIAQEEIFGPVISAIPFTDIDEVITRANSTMFGLGSRVWTDPRRQQGAPARQGHSGGLGVGELLPGEGPRGAVRWVQDERLRPRVGPAAARGVPEREGGLDQHRVDSGIPGRPRPGGLAKAPGAQLRPGLVHAGRAALADADDIPAYRRVSARVACGVTAWVYVDAQHAPRTEPLLTRPTGDARPVDRVRQA